MIFHGQDDGWPTQATQTVGNYQTTSFFRGISKKYFWGATQATQTVQTTKLQCFFMGRMMVGQLRQPKQSETTKLQAFSAA